MIKYFCDRCGKEMQSGHKMYTGAYDALGALITTIGSPKHLCDECSDKLDTIKDQLEHEEDIFNMTDEDIELLRYIFKVGDEVITSTGEVGHIDWICDCDNCKEREFFEPHVETEIGVGSIYITDGHKRRNFRSFYKIGNHVFGNIDEDAVDRSIESANSQITELEENLKQYYMQLDVIKCMKNGEELWDGD